MRRPYTAPHRPLPSSLSRLAVEPPAPHRPHRLDMSRRVPRSPERADAAAASITIPPNNPSRDPSPVTTSPLDLLATPRSTRSLTHRRSLVPSPTFGAPLETECPRCGVPMPTNVCPLCAYEEEENMYRRAQERSIERERTSNPTTPIRSLVDQPSIDESTALESVPATVVPPSNATSMAGSGPAHSASAVPLRIARPRARSSPPPSMYGRLSPDELDLFYRPEHLAINNDAGDKRPTSSQSGDGSATSPQWQPQSHSSPSTSLCPEPLSRPSTLTRGSSHSASGSSSGSPHPSLRRTLSQNHRHTRSHSLFDTISMTASDFPAAFAASNYASRTTNPTFNPSLGFRPSQIRLLSRSAVPSSVPQTAPAPPSVPLSSIPSSPIRSAHSFRDSPTPSSPEPRPDPTNVSDSQHEFDTDADHFARVPIPDVAYMPPSPASSTPSLTESVAIIVPTHSDYDSPAAGTDRRSLLHSPAPFVSSKIIIAQSVPADSSRPERGTNVVAASSPISRTKPPPSLAIPAYQPAVSPSVSPATSSRTSPAATSSPSASVRRAYFPITPGTPLSPRGPPPTAPLPPTPGPASPRARERKMSTPSIRSMPSVEHRQRPPSMPAPDWRMEYLKQYPTSPAQNRTRQGSAPVSPVAGIRRVSPSSKRLSTDQEARQQRLAALATAAESEVEPITDTDTDNAARTGLALLGLRPLLLEQKLRDDASRLSVSRTRPLSLSSNASVHSRRSTKSNQSVPRSLHRSAAQVEPDELPRTSLSVPPSPNATRVEFSFDASPSRSTAPTSSPARSSGKAKRLSVTSKSSKSDNERDRKRLSTGSTAPATPNSKRNSATRFSIVSFGTRSRKNSTRSGTSSHTRNASSQYAVPVPPMPVPDLPSRGSGVTFAATGDVVRRSRSSSKIGQFLRQVGRTLTGKSATDHHDDHDMAADEDEHRATQDGSIALDMRPSTTARSRGDTLLGASIDASSSGHGADLGRSRSHDLLRGPAPTSTLRAASALSLATTPPADESPLNGRAPRKWFSLLRRPSVTHP